MLAAFDPSPPRLLPGLALGSLLLLAPNAQAQSYVALMEGQRAVPLRGRFNTVPVLHSNQPEEVEGPGVLISTVPGVAIAAETEVEDLVAASQVAVSQVAVSQVAVLAEGLREGDLILPTCSGGWTRTAMA